MNEFEKSSFFCRPLYPSQSLENSFELTTTIDSHKAIADFWQSPVRSF